MLGKCDLRITVCIEVELGLALACSVFLFFWEGKFCSLLYLLIQFPQPRFMCVFHLFGNVSGHYLVEEYHLSPVKAGLVLSIYRIKCGVVFAFEMILVLP